MTPANRSPSWRLASARKRNLPTFSTWRRSGVSGETYAFDRNGILLSASRFEPQLKALRLLLDERHDRSVLNVKVRDPGVNLTQGGHASGDPADWPLTEMVQAAIKGGSGENVTGYRDYRGVESVSAWQWLDDYGFGVATEVDSDEAFKPMLVLRHAFWTLFGLLAAAALFLIGLSLVAGRLERRARRGDRGRQAGTIPSRGKDRPRGHGKRLRGHHDMLRRPTAIKVIDPDKTTEVSIARFEREVRLTSRLNHPNTITIYDFGRSDEGVFYYAMEFLDGFSLQLLVERFGYQPDGRVIQILSQVCGSLAEAHALGLIHRDIKPANIMLTTRGGVHDYVKLLDFGLVKAVERDQNARAHGQQRAHRHAALHVAGEHRGSGPCRRAATCIHSARSVISYSPASRSSIPPACSRSFATTSIPSRFRLPNGEGRGSRTS